jgi:hypothetical protein
MSKNKVIISSWPGYFGVRMSNYAFAKTYAFKNNMELKIFSKWEGSIMFKNATENLIDSPELIKYLSDTDILLNEKNKEIKKIYPNSKHWNGNHYYLDPYYNHNCDIIVSGTRFGEKIYDGMSLEYIRNIFELSDIVKQSKSYKYWESKKGTYDVAHLRRGDIADIRYSSEHKYSVISKESYYDAFNKFGYDKDKIEWISNDHLNIWHTDRPKTTQLPWKYPEGSYFDKNIIFDWLEDWIKIYFARTVFRSNSNFSFWACLLSPTAKVYSPVMNKKSVYGLNGNTSELMVEFTEGNENHWLYSDPYRQIRIR